ncbi:MAG: FHA domain-containing serine/threonine-protein kinase [Planctomycetota bacterium]
MEATFRVIVGADKGKSFTLRSGRSITVGRSSASDIELSEPRISRIHCQLTNNGTRVILTDLRSTNGTFLNDKRVKSAPLQSDDKIRIGSTVIAVELEGAEAAEPAQKRREEPASAIDEKLLESEPKPEAKAEARAEAKAEAAVAVEEKPKPKPKPKGVALPEEGQTIAGCRLITKIHEFDNEVTYRGLQLSIDRPVLIKILTTSAKASEEEIERFIGPARSAGKLNHPNVVQIHDAGAEEGVYYIVQELVEGRTIKELTSKGGKGEPLAVPLAVEIAVQVAIALDYAHYHKVMHGDVRPEKILICNIGKKPEEEIRTVRSLGIVRLMEFGPGGYLLGAESDAKRSIMGPTSLHNYRAPEQIQKNKPIDHRVDIYSLGAVLFRMLTGKPPFMFNKPEEVINAILETGIESPKEHNPTVPQSVCRIVETSMEKDPDDRYQMMEEMLEELKMLTELGA